MPNPSCNKLKYRRPVAAERNKKEQEGEHCGIAISGLLRLNKLPWDLNSCPKTFLPFVFGADFSLLQLETHCLKVTAVSQKSKVLNEKFIRGLIRIFTSVLHGFFVSFRFRQHDTNRRI